MSHVASLKEALATFEAFLQKFRIRNSSFVSSEMQLCWVTEFFASEFSDKNNLGLTLQKDCSNLNLFSSKRVDSV